MLVYFSTELLKELLDYYLPRYRLAVERGFAVQGSKYAWLYQSCPGGKVQFTRKHIEQYWERIESSPREKYARKPKKAKLIF